MNVGSLFSGIGGFDLGLERAGMRVVWQAESNSYRRAVLRKRWPGVPCYEDVRDVGADAERADLICGGFPCQDLSFAGKGAGITGARSGLWSEFARIVGELRPRYVVVENVPALAHRGLGRVLGDLAALGYDAEWDCLPAQAFGAPHRRDRLWLVAYPDESGRRTGLGEVQARQPDAAGAGTHSDSDGGRCEVGAQRHGWSQQPGEQTPLGHDADGLRDALADASVDGRRSGRQRRPDPGGARQPEQPLSTADAERNGLEGVEQAGATPGAALGGRGWWSVEPDVGRVADGIPSRVDRLSALGDALVPQIAEWIGRRLMQTVSPAGIEP